MTEPPGNGGPTLDSSTPSSGSGRDKNLRGLGLVQRMWLQSTSRVSQTPQPFRGTPPDNPDSMSPSIFKAGVHYSIAIYRHFGYVYSS